MIFPLTLLIDNKLIDSVLHLKYLDNDDRDEDLVIEPIDVDKLILTT